MIRTTFLTFSLLSAFGLSGQKDYVTEIEDYRQELNREFADPETSPLTEEDRAVFTTLEFFPISTAYRIEARFVKLSGQKAFEMPTSTDRKPRYIKYAEAHFELDGKKQVLSIYKNLELTGKEEYKDLLFLPFTDFTNGEETYGGGRYLDLKQPEGKIITLDFNKAYNPYCAYNYKYSCPIPPAENRLEIDIRAGVRDFNPTGH